MKFIFEAGLPHQLAAMEAVAELFAGQIAQEPAFHESLPGHANRCDLTDDALLKNLHRVQNRNALPVSPALHVTAPGSKDAGGDYGMDFTVEMETGTGKTYAYLRTIFELNRRYNFTKFVIVVPSLAIREGVRKTIEQTGEHFRQLYDGVPFESFVYDSADLSRIVDFACSAAIRVMIATVQSLGSKAAVFRQPREQTRDIAGVDWVKSTNPILIVDEPQSVDANPDGAGRQIMRAMQPLATIRYSATHAARFHPVYRLDAFDAHDRGLVKSIEVDGARISDADNSPYVKLLEVEAKKGHPPRARIEIARQMTGGVSRQTVWAGSGDRLEELSGGRGLYAGHRIGTIEKMRGAGSMQLITPDDGAGLLHIGESRGDVEALSLARAMLRRTIIHHFRKELRNRPLGIKTLSLFFIDRVADYRLYDETGAARPGPLATMFEEEYADLAAQPRFQPLFAIVPAEAERAHGGYFAQDRHGRFTDPSLDRHGHFSSQKSREEAERSFDLIMKDKERLLDEAEPLRFLFSHSALREGWDNPNVFQICALREMGSEMRRRQSIGRGLRLCVDQNGQRRREEGLNILTIIAQEDYTQFAQGLQAEMEAALDIRLGVVTPELFAGLTYALPDGGTAMVPLDTSRAIVTTLAETGMIDGKGLVTPKLRSALAETMLPLPPGLPEAAARLVIAMLQRLCRKLPISKASDRQQAAPKRSALEGHPFQPLWSRISRRVTYRLALDDAALVERCVEALRVMPPPGAARVTFDRAAMLITRDGVTPQKHGASQPQPLATAHLAMPDLLGELQDRTDLPRQLLADLLIQSGRLTDAAVNPSAFIDAVAKIIQTAKRQMMRLPIAYRPLNGVWAQSLLMAEGMAPMPDRQTPEEIAKALKISGPIKLFARLPAAFTVTTPLGSCHPDLVVVQGDEGREEVYLISDKTGPVDHADQPRNGL